MNAVNAVRRLLGATVGRAIRLLLTGLIVGYRRVLSPLLGPRCRFYPSCSTYGLEAITVHGAAKGTLLTVSRVCRCNPWNAGGVDHVPPRGAWKPEPYVSLESSGSLVAPRSPESADLPGGAAVSASTGTADSPRHVHCTDDLSTDDRSAA
jgi:putative membrane protein insertion efficiency factor